MEQAERTEYLSCAETAKLLRQALKAGFPGVKFSVRSHTYSGGASIDVTWTDGPAAPQVEAVTSLYTGASFDGMQDLKEYHSSLLSIKGEVVEVRYGADFIFCHRDLSEDGRVRCARGATRSTLGGEHPLQCRACMSFVQPGSGLFIADQDAMCSAECAGRRMSQWTDLRARSCGSCGAKVSRVLFSRYDAAGAEKCLCGGILS